MSSELWGFPDDDDLLAQMYGLSRGYSPKCHTPEPVVGPDVPGSSSDEASEVPRPVPAQDHAPAVTSDPRTE